MSKRDARREPRRPVAPYLAHYRRVIDARGPSFEATGWRNPEMQIERFRVKVDMFDFTGLTLLDAGSGRADFAAYLVEHGVEFLRYIGLDAMPEMVEHSRARGIPRSEHHVCDFVGDTEAFERFASDVIVFGGSLNTLPQREALRVLDRAWTACRVGLIFNFLSSRCPDLPPADPEDPALRFDPLAMLDWALEQSPFVTLRHDYLAGHDATIAVCKGDDAGG